MIFQILSDLHLERIKDKRSFLKELKSNADVVLMAGDIMSFFDAEETIKTISEVFHDQTVIFIAGNHEYYGTFLHKANDIFKKESDKFENVQFLNNDYIDFGDIILLGTCGWWDDFNETGCYMMNDFIHIRDLRENKKAGLEYSTISKNFLIESFEKFYDKKIIVMTHNAPLHDFIPGKYIGSPLNPFFANEWGYMIKKYEPVIWVSGHLHEYKFFYKYNTLFVENCFGYYKIDENPNFDKNLLIKVNINIGDKNEKI